MQHIVPGLIVVFVAVAAYGVYAWARRRKELQQWAAARGLTYHQGRDYGFDRTYQALKCLDQGHTRYACNVMTGQWSGLPVVCFDYRYRTGSGKNERTHTFSGVILRSPVPLKPLLIRREGLLDKIGEFLGADDIDFESAEFSRRFFVKSSDKRWAYDVIHQRMMEYLLAGPDLNVEFGVQEVVASDGRDWRPAAFQAAADHLKGILDLLPDYLVEQQKATMPPEPTW